MQPVRRSRTTTASFSLEGFNEYLGLSDCLALIWREMGRIGADVGDLAPYQRELLYDLASPIDEEAMAEMLNYWEYDIPFLSKRGRCGWKNIPAKPRIDVEIEITSKRNLKAEWFPKGFNRWGAPYGVDDSDFVFWNRQESRGSTYYERPSNELIFLHSAGNAISALEFGEREWARPFKDLDHVLLQACAKAVDLLKDRLEYHFDVRMITDVFVEYTPVPEIEDRWDAPPPRIVRWELADPERKKAEAEEAEIGGMEECLGFSAEHLLATWKAVEDEAAGLKSVDLHARVARRLRDAGFAIKRPAVERAMELIRNHERRSGKVTSFPDQQPPR